MVASHRGHTEMVYLLLKDGKADTTLTDSYGKKAIDRASSSHISYLIASASIENRMKDLSSNLNIKILHAASLVWKPSTLSKWRIVHQIRIRSLTRP